MLSQIRLSVCPSHGWISRKRLKLGSCSFSPYISPIPLLLRYKFHPEILRGSPEWGRQTRLGWEKLANFRSSNTFARWLHKLELLSLMRGPNSELFARWRHCRALTVASAALSCYVKLVIFHIMSVTMDDLSFIECHHYTHNLQIPGLI